MRPENHLARDKETAMDRRLIRIDALSTQAAIAAALRRAFAEGRGIACTRTSVDDEFDELLALLN